MSQYICRYMAPSRFLKNQVAVTPVGSRDPSHAAQLGFAKQHHSVTNSTPDVEQAHGSHASLFLTSL